MPETVKFKFGNKTKLEDAVIEDGSLLFAKDTGDIMFDADGNRVSCGVSQTYVDNKVATKMPINPTSITCGEIKCNSVSARSTSTLEIIGSSVSMSTLPVGGTTPDTKLIVSSGDSTNSPSAFPFGSNTMDLGTPIQKFKNLYISGDVVSASNILATAKQIVSGITMYQYGITESKLSVTIKSDGAGFIDWGDGTVETTNTGDNTHTYAVHGTYNIYISNPDISQVFGSDNINSAESRLLKVILSEQFSSIPERMFQHCINCTSVTLPETLETINKWAFEGCTGLQNIKLPNALKTIDRAAFNGCNTLYEITIPFNVTTIAKDAFNNCTNMRMMYVKPLSPPILSTDGILGEISAELQYIVVPSGKKNAYKTEWTGLESKIAEISYISA